MEAPEITTEKAREVTEQVIPGVTAGNVLDAMEDPKVFEEIARGDLYIQMALMRQAAARPDFPTTTRMEYIRTLSKMGKVDTPERGMSDLDRLPGINIIFPSGGGVSIGVQPVRTERDITPPTDSGRIMPSKAVLP